MNTPSPGTDGAVCRNCDARLPSVHALRCHEAYRNTNGVCPTAKADCAPVVADLPAGSLAAQIESARASWASVPDRYKGEPSKRDATEVRRAKVNASYFNGPLSGSIEAVPLSDHAAAIQASLAREAALEAELEREREASARNDIAGYDTIAEVAAERDALRSRLAAVEAEKAAAQQRIVLLREEAQMMVNACAHSAKEHVSITDERDKARTERNHYCEMWLRHEDTLALQAEKVGRMRVALRKFGYHSRECSNDRYRQGAIGAALTCACGYDAALKDA